MNFSKYQKEATTTMMFNKKIALPYILLGIVGESSELFEKIVKSEQEGEKQKDLIIKEMGDIFWYLAAWSDFVDNDLEKLIISTLTKEKPHPVFLAMDIVIESGRIAEYGKKLLRDNFEQYEEGILDETKKASIDASVGKIAGFLMKLSMCYQLDYETILQANIDKLKSRVDRGVIGGSGDER